MSVEESLYDVRVYLFESRLDKSQLHILPQL